MRLLGLMLVVAGLAACATGPADRTLDAEAKQVRALPDKACLYIVPSNSTTAVTVALDGRKVSTLEESNYLRLDVPPGRHVLAVTPASFLPSFLREKSDTITLETEAGRCYFLRTLWGESTGGLRQFRVYWAQVPEAEGQREINIRRLALPTK